MLQNHLFLLNVMRIEDILSIPYSLLVSLAISSSRSSSKIFPCYFLSSNLLVTQATMSSLDFTSQIPSQPIMIKSRFWLGILMMSGLAVMIWSYGGNLAFPLYSKSPSALERFKLPFTLPYWTYPPAFVIRFISRSSSGLWSMLSGTTFLFTDATARESPAFAQ